MNRKHTFLLFALLCSSSIFAQLGIKTGVNMTTEVKTFNRSEITNGFNSTNLTGYQIGLVYQAMPKKSGFGFEIAALISQKGSSFNDSTNIVGVIKQGYKEMNYLEIPLNLRYRLSLGVIGIYGFGGIYGGYALSGKVVDEMSNSTQSEIFASSTDRMDYGYNFGAGLEIFKKIQLGATWSQGVKDISNTNIGLPTSTKTSNRVLTINIIYLL